MLKRTLTAEEHAALAPELQSLYVAAADGNGFTLDVDPDPAVRTLQTQIGEFRENNITLTQQMKELRQSRQPPPENAALEEKVADLTRIVTEEREATQRERDARAEDRFQIRVAEIGSKERGASGSSRGHGFSCEGVGLPRGRVGWHSRRLQGRRGAHVKA